MAAFKVVKGKSTKPPVKVGFAIFQKGPEKDRLPKGVYLVRSTRARTPYVLSLLLYVNEPAEKASRSGRAS
jgi:hypothetical protein